MNKTMVLAGSLIVPAVLIIGVSVSGAQADGLTASSAGEGVFLSTEVAEESLAKETSSFERALPEGVSWTDELGVDDADGVKVRVQESFVETTAATYWLCAWEDALVTRTNAGDVEGATEALAEVDAFTSLEVYKKNFIDPKGGWRRDVAAPAMKGDLAGVKSELASGCSLFYGAQGAQ